MPNLRARAGTVPFMSAVKIRIVCVGARERLFRLRKDLEGHIRGMPKTLGIRMTGVGQGRQRQGFRDQLAAAGETDPVLRTIADGHKQKDIDQPLPWNSKTVPAIRFVF